MADLSDVETSLVSTIAAAIYPNGTGAASATGFPTRIYRGWPNKTALDADIAAGTVNVTVFPEAGGRNTTRFPRRWQDISITVPTITASVSGLTVTLAGAAGVAQLVGIRSDAGTWVVSASAIDTPATVAASLRAMIAGSSGSGSTVIMPSGSQHIFARTGGIGGGIEEVRRQVQSFRITCWCHTAAVRDTTAALVDASLGALPWIPLADGAMGRLIYRWTHTDDVPTKDALWRRDFRYDVEYGTTAQQMFAKMLFGGGELSLNGNAGAPFGDLPPS